MRLTRGRPAALSLALVGGLLVTSLGFASADTGTTPSFLRTLGGPGHADMYPSGVEIDPADGSYVVADTGNNRVKKYSAGGALLWDVGGYGTTTSPLRFNGPRDIGVDSTGAVYVADTANTRIVKLDGATGAVIGTPWKGAGADKIGSPIGITVSLFDDLVYVADAGKKMVRVYNHSGTQMRAFGQSGTCTFSNIRDVDAGPNGDVYIANYLQKNVLVMSSNGDCLDKWGVKGTGDGQFKNPYGVRVAFDPTINANAVFVADSNNNRVQEFRLNGTFVAKFGTTGMAQNQFAAMRRVAVSPPYPCAAPAGSCIDVAGVDLWGWKISIWSTSGTSYALSRTIPSPVVPPPGDGGTTLSNPVTSVFNEPRGIAFASDGSLRIMDSVNQRIVRIDRFGNLASGAGAWATCGQRGWTAGAFNWPRGVAVDQATGDLWVADTKQSRLQVIKSDCTSPQFIGKAGSSTTSFNWPYSIAIRQSDRLAFVADTKNHRINVYNVATRGLLTNFGSLGAGAGQFNQPAGIAVDPVDGHVFVADRNNGRIVELAFNGSSFTWVGSYGTAGTTATGKLKRPEGVAVDSKGRIYVADSANNRLVVLQSSGAVLGTVTGMKTPQNVAVDQDDCVYVADTFNDRIQVYTYEETCS